MLNSLLELGLSSVLLLTESDPCKVSFWMLKKLVVGMLGKDLPYVSLRDGC